MTADRLLTVIELALLRVRDRHPETIIADITRELANEIHELTKYDTRGNDE